MKAERNKSHGGLYNYGAKLVELGKALQDKRTTMDEVSDLAFACGLNLEFRFKPVHGDEVVKPRVDAPTTPPPCGSERENEHRTED